MVIDNIMEARGSQPRRSARSTPRRSAAAARLRRYCTTAAAAAIHRGVCCVAAGRVVIEGHWLAWQKIWVQWGYVPIKFSAAVLALNQGDKLCPPQVPT